MELVSVAAVAENGVIGDGEDVPWDLPADVEQYRERVDGHPVIVGRRTYEMYSDPPGSAQIVMSRSEREFDRDTAYHAGSVDEALDLAESMDSEFTGSEAVYVIGGGAVYEALQPHLDRMVLTQIPGEYEGDVYYPDWDEADWELVSTEDYPKFTVETWERAD